MKNFVFLPRSMPRTILLLSEVAVFFIASNTALYAASIGYHSPVDCCASRSVIVLGRMGGDSLSYLFNYLIFCSPMPRMTKNQSGAKHSNAAMTSAHETRKKLYSKFLVEKDAKNLAYSFILSSGLYRQFADFCSNGASGDPFTGCLGMLLIGCET